MTGPSAVDVDGASIPLASQLRVVLLHKTECIGTRSHAEIVAAFGCGGSLMPPLRNANTLPHGVQFFIRAWEQMTHTGSAVRHRHIVNVDSHWKP